MSERLRLETLCARDGMPAAKQWANWAADLYRQSMSDSIHYTFLRHSLIGSHVVKRIFVSCWGLRKVVSSHNWPRSAAMWCYEPTRFKLIAMVVMKARNPPEKTA